MKKIMVFALALSLSAVSISCKKGMDKITSSVLQGGKANEANAIIDFNNNFLESYKNTSRHVEGIVKYADAAAAKIKGENVMMMPVILSSMDYQLAKIKEVPAGFEKDKASIEADFKIYKAKKESIEKKYEELKSYMTSEDYKDDKGAKAEAIKKELETEAKDFFTAGENIIAKIKPATDAAEEIALKDHPLKEYIFSSKNLMNSLDAAYIEVGKEYEGKFNEAEAQKKYDEFAKAVENNAKLNFNVKDPQYAYKKTLFENVNKRSVDFLDTYRKLIRNSKTEGQVPDSDMRQMDSSYDMVLSAYNTFVQ